MSGVETMDLEQAPKTKHENGHPAGAGAAPVRPAEPAVEKKKGLLRRPSVWVMLVLVVLGVAGGTVYWLMTRGLEDTDDAFIDGRVVPISAKVTGTAERVLVQDNQDVAAGTLLVQIDPRDIKARLDRAQADLEAAESKLDVAKTNVTLTQANTGAAVSQAEAGVAQAQAGVTAAESQLASAEADVAAAKAESQRRQADLKRYQQADPRGVSQQQIDAARAAADAAEAQLTAANKKVASAQSAVAEAKAKVSEAEAVRQEAQTAPQQVANAQAQVKAAQAAVDEAQASVRELKLQLSYTSVYAPVAGRVTRKAVLPGQNINAAQPLLALVEPDVWVTANFKETQLTHMRRGQEVEIKVDAYPGRTFKGKVDSIQAGTGARFSLLPPENATGNYVKVVQRIPVKILFADESGNRPLLSLGMSVVPTVHVGTSEDGGPLPIEAPATQPAVASR